MENTKSIGICPICGRGHITEHPFGWACDNSSKNADGTWYNCKFVVFRQYHGAILTEDDVKTLLETGETGELQMQNKEGKPFTGKLVIKEGKVQLAFPPRYLQGRCPVCGGRIKVTGKGYACENFFEKDDHHCNFFVGSSICNRVITEQEVENFLAGKKQILDGFCSKAGKHFSSLLSTTVEGKVMLNSTICQCPQCGGEIRVGARAYNCSNYSNEDVKCQFSVWRTIDGHEVTPDEVKQLCDKGETDEVIHFYRKDGTQFDKKLKLEDGKVILA